MVCNKLHFSKLSNINILLNIKQNLIEYFYLQNKCLNSNTCYVWKRVEESKDDFTKKRQKKLKRVKDIIKHKGCQKWRELKRCLNIPVLRRTCIFFTTHKAFLFFIITNLHFYFLKVVSSSLKNTPPVYCKYNVNNKYLTVLFLSFSFLSFAFHIF